MRVDDAALAELFQATDERFAHVEQPKRLQLVMGVIRRTVVAEMDTQRATVAPAFVYGVIDEVSAHFGLTRADLLGRSIVRHIRRARAVCWWVLRRKFDVAFPVLARVFDRTDVRIQLTLHDFCERLPGDARSRDAIAKIFETTAYRREAA